MMRKVVALILVLIFMSALHVLAADEAMADSFCKGWTFWSDTHSERTTVSVPHDAMQTEKRSSANHAGELIYVDINIVGENGEVESKADQQLKVTVNGGELLGFGSAQPYTEENFHSGCYTTYYGRSLAVIRATMSGLLRIDITGNGMQKVLNLNINNR